MKYYSTNGGVKPTSLKEAVLKGLADDKGLYMPETIVQLPASFFENLGSMSLQDIAFEVSKLYVDGDIPDNELRALTDEVMSFDIPVVNVEKNLNTLELFHGPTLAFKDIGARFTSRLMGHFLKGDNRKIRILVATSGDTGGAVASGFFNVPNISVTILYPRGKVSDIQEKQLTTMGGNIEAVEIEGTFDDCQRLVKEAFLDKEVTAKMNLSSSNSINIARLIPQSFYYYYAIGQLTKEQREKGVVFSICSGNFGHITAGILAKRTGLNIDQLVAATNINDIVPEYLDTKVYTARPSTETISNAMDVGDPSNFKRMMDMYDNSHEEISKDITGCRYTDDQTREVMRDVYKRTSYVLDPHGAIGYMGLRDYLGDTDKTGIFFETAHPAKFLDVVEETLDTKIEIPQPLLDCIDKEKVSTVLSKDYADFKTYLLG
ncbi:MAG: threonine synthase [Flavobacteriales bacterium]|nr:threonine synthase [Flavobacteriales bacterium]